MHIALDDPTRADVLALLEEHLRDMRALSPPESVHALDVVGLKSPDVTFWSVREGGLLLGCGALRQIDATPARSSRCARRKRCAGAALDAPCSRTSSRRRAHAATGV